MPGISQDTANQLHQQTLLHMNVHQAKLALKKNIDETIVNKLHILLELLEDISQAVIAYDERIIEHFQTQKDDWLLSTSMVLALVLIVASWIAWRLVSGFILTINQLKMALLGLSAGKFPTKTARMNWGKLPGAYSNLSCA